MLANFKYIITLCFKYKSQIHNNYHSNIPNTPAFKFWLTLCYECKFPVNELRVTALTDLALYGGNFFVNIL